MRGRVFDGSVFAGNIFLAGFLVDLVHEATSGSAVFPVLLIATVLFYSIAALIKRKPLQLRLEQTRREEMSGWGYLLFLVLFCMHYGLFASCMSFALECLFPQGLPAFAEIVLVLGAGFLPTALSIFALIPLGGNADRTPPAPGIELFADSLIYISLMVIFAFWEGIFVDVLAGKGEENLWLSLAIIIPVTVPFAMFYLAPRVLFLIEDYRERKTWVNCAFVMAPLAVRIAFP